MWFIDRSDVDRITIVRAWISEGKSKGFDSSITFTSAIMYIALVSGAVFDQILYGWNKDSSIWLTNNLFIPIPFLRFRIVPSIILDVEFFVALTIFALISRTCIPPLVIDKFFATGTLEITTFEAIRTVPFLRRVWTGLRLVASDEFQVLLRWTS